MVRSRLASFLTLAAFAGGCGRSSSPMGPESASSLATRCMQPFGDPATSAYRLPYSVGRSYTLFQGNCPRDPTWGHYGWFAYDFNLAIGDTILAARAGVVGFVAQHWPDADRVCGHENSVWVLHDDGTVMVYAHLTTNGARVTVGDRLSAGQLIGLSGDSGCSSGPHLHIGLYKDRFRYDREDSRPFNFSNAIGPHDSWNGLAQGGRFTAR